MIFGIVASAAAVLIIARRFWRPDSARARPLVDRPSALEALLGLALIALGLFSLAELVREPSDVSLFLIVIFLAFGATSVCSATFHASTKAAGVGWRSEIVFLASIFAVGILFGFLAHEVGGIFRLLSILAPTMVLIVWAISRQLVRGRRVGE
jgi:hypothetical protein